jgi:hypothetical protein
MVRTLIVEIELAKAAVCKVQRHLLAQRALMTNAIAATDQQHPDHQLGIDRGSTDNTVERRQILPNLFKIHEPVD